MLIIKFYFMEFLPMLSASRSRDAEKSDRTPADTTLNKMQSSKALIRCSTCSIVGIRRA